MVQNNVEVAVQGRANGTAAPDRDCVELEVAPRREQPGEGERRPFRCCKASDCQIWVRQLNSQRSLSPL